MTKYNNSIYLYLKALFGIFLLLYILYHVGVDSISIEFRNLQARYILPCLLSFALFLLLGAFILKISSNPFIDNKISFYSICKYYLLSFSFATFTPGRIGEASFIYFLKRQGVTLGQGTVVFLIIKIVRLILFFLVALWGFFTFFNYETALKLSMIALSIFFGFCIILNSRVRSRIIAPFIKSYADKLERLLIKFWTYCRSQRSTLLKIVILTFIQSVMAAIMVYFAFRIFHCKVDMLSIYLISASVVIVSALPISLNGLGVSEGSSIYLYSLLGIAPAATMSVAVFYRAIHSLLSAIVLGFYFVRKRSVSPDIS